MRNTKYTKNRRRRIKRRSKVKRGKRARNVVVSRGGIRL